MKKKKFGLVGYILVAVVVASIINLAMLAVWPHEPPATLYDDYTSVETETMYESIRNGSIKTAMLVNGNLYAVMTDGSQQVTTADDSMVNTLQMSGILQREATVSSGDSNGVWVFVSFVLIAIIAGFILSIYSASKSISKAMDSMPKQTMGKSEKGGIQKERPNVHFSDVQGIDSIRKECEDAVDALKHPQAYKEIGARPKKGILLAGAPGTGKTLLAKAIAGEAGVSFISMSGSDFIEKYVGVGASRVRELYAQAAKAAPCVVFIDEIDAVGASRGMGENSERDQTINALLTAMDGFDGGEGILTIAATNRLDMLDAALTRPGRFDLTLNVPLPDRKGRLAILKSHAKNKRLSMEVDLDNLAGRTVGFSGAELASLLNESACIAVTKKRRYVTNDDIEDAYFKIIAKGTKKPLDKTSDTFEATNRLIAWHEAGHAVVTKLLTKDEVPMVTIIGTTSGAGGFTVHLPEEGVINSRNDILNKIRISYGGRAAEHILLGNDDDITIGASADIRTASAYIKKYLADWGLGSTGLLIASDFESEKNLFEEAKTLAGEVYGEVESLLANNRDVLERVANGLIARETIDEETLDALIAGKTIEELDAEETEPEVKVSATADVQSIYGVNQNAVYCGVEED